MGNFICEGHFKIFTVQNWIYIYVSNDMSCFVPLLRKSQVSGKQKGVNLHTTIRMSNWQINNLWLQGTDMHGNETTRHSQCNVINGPWIPFARLPTMVTSKNSWTRVLKAVDQVFQKFKLSIKFLDKSTQKAKKIYYLKRTEFHLYILWIYKKIHSSNTCIGAGRKERNYLLQKKVWFHHYTILHKARPWN